jgi:hypothetical protein
MIQRANWIKPEAPQWNRFSRRSFLFADRLRYLSALVYQLMTDRRMTMGAIYHVSTPGQILVTEREQETSRGPKNSCRRCNWQTSDCARATSTSNRENHVAKHGIFLHSVDGAEDGGIKQQSISSLFRKRTETEISKRLEQNLIRWTVLDNMAFTAIESPAFQQIFDTPGIALSIHMPERLFPVKARISSE